MDLLIDLFGYLSVVVHGLTILAQSVAFGSVFFLVFLVRALARAIGEDAAVVEHRCNRLAAWAAIALLVCEATTVGLQALVLVGTVQLSFLDVLPAEFAVAGRRITNAQNTAATVAALFGGVFAVGLAAAFFRGEAEMSALALGLCGGSLVSGVLFAPYLRRSAAPSLGAARLHRRQSEPVS